ncbi:hypothetical protein A5781_10060 [Mycobacterium sp. 852002-30065_SCH5024008]|nr:hypothetical protein A5781_10060 [Mycobacterium sp. 852002-30065_SCH5024008]
MVAAAQDATIRTECGAQGHSERGAIIVGEGAPSDGREQETSQRSARPARLGSISVDWWATAVAGVIVALAVANVLPKIPW